MTFEKPERLWLISRLAAMSVDQPDKYACEIEWFRRNHRFMWDEVLVRPTSLPSKEMGRLLAFLGKIGSDNVHERIAAVSLLERLRSTHGLSWDDMLPRPVTPRTRVPYTHVWQDPMPVNWPVTLTGHTTQRGGWYRVEVKLSEGWLDPALEARWSEDGLALVPQEELRYQRQSPF